MNIYSKDNPPDGFYVYAYIRTKDSTNGKAGTPYYIGKGKGHRAYYRSNSEATKPLKDNSNIVILEANLTEIGSLALERRYIRWWGRMDLGSGVLHNRTDGGDGISNPSEEIRKKISMSRKGKKLSPEHKKKLSKIRTGKKRPNQSEKMKGSNNPMFGKSRVKTKGSTGMKWYTNGTTSILTYDCPTDFIPGNSYMKLREKSKQPKVDCPHCGKVGGAHSMKRYHFDNCKLFPLQR